MRCSIVQETVDPAGTTQSEGIQLIVIWHWGTKVWGAKGIRDPSSPHCKLCALKRTDLSVTLKLMRQMHHLGSKVET